MTDDFETVMELPHRRHAYGVNAPALFRHVGFRITEHEQSPLAAIDFESNVNLRDQIIRDINKELIKIQEKCGSRRKDQPSETLFERSHTLFNGLPELPPTLSHWRARIRVDIWVEFYFVTFILDQKRPVEGDVEKIEKSLSEGTYSDARGFIKRHYEELWNDFNAHLGQWQDALPGDNFTEFRGVALRDHKSPFHRSKDGRRADEVFKIPQLNPDLIESFRTSLRQWLDRNKHFISELMQLKVASGSTDRDANNVLCELLDGAAIYCSATRQAEDPSAGGKRPLRYFVLYTALSKYQLGRLIRRAHALGEFRCAAVLDLEKIEEAGARIRALGNKINKMLDDDKQLRDDSESATLTDAQLRTVQSELNDLAYCGINGGLLYRINRSRYYATIFRDRVDEMRPKKLEGWQTYAEFFRRNLYPHFDEIDQIGKRYEALGERVNRLIHTRNTEKLNDFQSTMIRIQRLGEIIGLAAFTYYGGHILSSAFMSVAKWRCLQDLWCLWSADHDRDFMEIAGMFTALCLALGLYRWWSHRPSRHREGSNAHSIASR